MRRKPPVERQTTGASGYVILGIVFTLVACGIWVYVNRANIQEYSTAYRSREQAKTKIAETQKRISQLKRQQQSLDANGVESVKRIRERLNLHFMGEKVYFFVDEDSTTTARSARPTTATAVQAADADS